ncbi:helix-turn-helix transcriptional regulator [Bacillus sp. AG4(2022)]|uniref:helix-turn-helix transcriptional regulator n=1 Tax=Bacillus sp. AG4(2022) TaxID=2962594 RepID=UPI0028811A6A|nr:helix-turn-helix transcriptional regulator [Bacillus sp. AG4(2022)]MDT0160298.1 helix-turn-helix transcriptional regulator [Bacillus sp. AG4(2022)]
MEYERVVIHLRKDIVDDIRKIVEYKNLKDFLFDDEDSYVNVEEFVIGCVCYYLRQIKGTIDLSGISMINSNEILQNRLHELLEQKRMTQLQLSEQTGIAPSNINNYIKNKNQPSLEHFMRIWITLGCPPLNWLLHRIPKPE